MCGICVPMFDHHCVWLNQCVGEHNYRWFITFLFVNSMFLFYGATVIYLVLISKVCTSSFKLTVSEFDPVGLWAKSLHHNLCQQKNGGGNEANSVFISLSCLQEFKASYYMIGMYILNSNLGLVLVFLVAAIMGIAIFCFFLYHFYLLCIGQTTNETFKWGKTCA